MCIACWSLKCTRWSAEDWPVARESGRMLGWIHRRKWVKIGGHHLKQMSFILLRAASRGHGRCFRLWDVSVAFFHAATHDEATEEHEERQDHLNLWKPRTARKMQKSRWQRLVHDTLCDGHWRVLTSMPCCIQ